MSDTQTIPVDPDLADIILDAISARLFDVHTALPAKVVTFDPATQSVTVQPLLKRTYLDEDEEEETVSIPQITNVPVWYPAGGGWSITWPLVAGDIVLLVFAERSLDRWLDAPKGQEVDPVDSRRHDLSDAVAYPGMRPRTAPIDGISTTDLRLVHEDGLAELVITPGGSVTVKATTIALGGPAAIHRAVHGDVLVGALQAFLTAVTAAAPPLPPPDPIAAVIAMGAAAAGLNVALGLPPGPAGVLSPKVVVE